MMTPDLPPGYTPARGRAPSVSIWGSHVYCVIRGGENGPVIGKEPWPIAGTRWTWEDHPGDIIAIRKAD